MNDAIENFNAVEDILYFVENSLIKEEYKNDKIVKDTMSKIETCINICNAIGDEIYKLESPYQVICRSSEKPAAEILYNMNYIKIDMIYIIIHHNVTQLNVLRNLNEIQSGCPNINNPKGLFDNSPLNLFSSHLFDYVTNSVACRNAVYQYLEDNKDKVINKYDSNSDIFKEQNPKLLYAAILRDTMVLDKFKFVNFIDESIKEIKEPIRIDLSLNNTEKFNSYLTKTKYDIYDKISEKKRNDCNYSKIKKELSLDLKYYQDSINNLKYQLRNNYNVFKYLEKLFSDKK